MITVGNIIEGKVVKIMPFGAFVDLGGNQSGMVHISEISQNYVQDIAEHIKEGDTVKVKVVKIDEKGRISLSIRQAQETGRREKPKKAAVSAEHKPVRPADIDWSEKSSDNLSFEDKLSKFKQDSDEKIRTLKRNSESKRSGGYSRKGNFSF